MISVLIADPDEDTRIIVSTALRNVGIDVVEAANPESAENIVADQHFDLIILNYPMPLASGVTLTRALREHHRMANVPVLNFSSHITAHLLAAAEADGVTHTIEKPADIDAVIEMVYALTRDRPPNARMGAASHYPRS